MVTRTAVQGSARQGKASGSPHVVSSTPSLSHIRRYYIMNTHPHTHPHTRSLLEQEIQLPIPHPNWYAITNTPRQALRRDSITLPPDRTVVCKVQTNIPKVYRYYTRLGLHPEYHYRINDIYRLCYKPTLPRVILLNTALCPRLTGFADIWQEVCIRLGDSSLSRQPMHCIFYNLWLKPSEYNFATRVRYSEYLRYSIAMVRRRVLRYVERWHKLPPADLLYKWLRRVQDKVANIASHNPEAYL